MPSRHPICLWASFSATRRLTLFNHIVLVTGPVSASKLPRAGTHIIREPSAPADWQTPAPRGHRAAPPPTTHMGCELPSSLNPKPGLCVKARPWFPPQSEAFTALRCRVIFLSKAPGSLKLKPSSRAPGWGRATLNALSCSDGHLGDRRHPEEVTGGCRVICDLPTCLL